MKIKYVVCEVLFAIWFVAPLVLLANFGLWFIPLCIADVFTPFWFRALARKSKNKFLKELNCDQFDWHDGNGQAYHKFDGATFHSTCSICGKEVMQDSQGNWFTFN